MSHPILWNSIYPREILWDGKSPPPVDWGRQECGYYGVRIGGVRVAAFPNPEAAINEAHKLHVILNGEPPHA